MLDISMKLKQTLLSLGLATMILGGSFAFATTANALECNVLPDFICGSADDGNLETSGTWKLLIFIIDIMTAGVGLVAVVMIAYAAFRYTTAQSDEGVTKEAKEIIRNVAIGIAVYAMMWAMIQWLVPGGVFS